MNARHQFAIRVVFAIVAWSGVGLQLGISIAIALSRGGSVASGVSDYLRFFTTFTNLLMALAVTAPLVQRRLQVFQWFSSPLIVGCAAVSGIVMSLIYHFLLRHPLHGLFGLTEVLLHYVTPAIAVVYGFLFLRAHRLPWWSSLVWWLYPISYFIYVLARGALTGGYPYPFLDVLRLGYPTVIGNGIVICGAFLIAGYIFLGITRVFRSANPISGNPEAFRDR